MDISLAKDLNPSQGWGKYHRMRKLKRALHNTDVPPLSLAASPTELTQRTLLG
jgi:hypothetical protein